MCIRYNALPTDEREKLVSVFANLLQHDPNKIARQPDSIAAGIQPPVVSTPAVLSPHAPEAALGDTGGLIRARWQASWTCAIANGDDVGRFDARH